MQILRRFAVRKRLSFAALHGSPLVFPPASARPKLYPHGTLIL